MEIEYLKYLATGYYVTISDIHSFYFPVKKLTKMENLFKKIGTMNRHGLESIYSPEDYCLKNGIKLIQFTNSAGKKYAEYDQLSSFNFFDKKKLKVETLLINKTLHVCCEAVTLETLKKVSKIPYMKKSQVEYPYFFKRNVNKLGKEILENKESAFTVVDRKVEAIYNLEELGVKIIPEEGYKKYAKRELFSDNDISSFLLKNWLKGKLRCIGVTEKIQKIYEVEGGIINAFDPVDEVDLKMDILVPLTSIKKFDSEMKRKYNLSVKEMKVKGMSKNYELVFDKNDEKFKKIRIKMIVDPIQL